MKVLWRYRYLRRPASQRFTRLAAGALIASGILCLCLCLCLSGAVVTGWWQGTLDAFGVGFTVGGLVDVTAAEATRWPQRHLVASDGRQLLNAAYPGASHDSRLQIAIPVAICGNRPGRGREGQREALSSPTALRERKIMEDTWVNRDLPVLDAVVRLLDDGAFRVSVSDVVGETSFDAKAVDRALTALDGSYVTDYTQFATGGIPDNWYVTGVTAEARRVVGQWPTAESLAARLAEAFSEAADQEKDPERKSRLRQLASFLGEAGKDIAAEIMAKVIMHQTGMG